MESDILVNIGSRHKPAAWQYQAIVLINVDLLPREYIIVKLKRNLNLLIEENAFANVVCKMEAILFRPQSVNQWKL